MNKTIYIRDEDVPIWDRAKELAGDKLSPIIVEGLRRFIAEQEAKEAEAKGFKRIIVQFNDAAEYGLPKAKAFFGKWIIPPEKREVIRSEAEHKQWAYAVAVTAKGAAVFNWIESEEYGQGEYLSVFPSLEKAAAESDLNWPARKAIEKMGVPVEELDI